MKCDNKSTRSSYNLRKIALILNEELSFVSVWVIKVREEKEPGKLSRGNPACRVEARPAVQVVDTGLIEVSRVS